MEGGTFSMVVFRGLCAALLHAGADVTSLLADLGVPAESLADADARLPITVAFRAFEEAPRRSGDPCFGLHAAEAMPLGSLEVLDFAVRSCATLGEALARVSRYYALVDDRTTIEVVVEGEVARFVGRNRTRPIAPRTATELLFALVMARTRELTGRDLVLHEVSFLAEGPPDAAEHERFFGAPVRFGQPLDELRFDRSFLDLPIRTADPALASFLERYAEEQLAKLPRVDPFLDRARRAVSETLRGGEPSVPDVAKRLAVSVRTLQRKLGELGTSHQQLVDDVRRELADRLLRDPQLAIAEVAYLLGFSDASTFHRAFKRWTGHTPAEHRRASRPPPPPRI